MSRFAENLAGLTVTENLAAVELAGPDGQRQVIENQPGSQGSLRVYAYLAANYGGVLGADAAQAGLALYAEHTEDARAHPGKHPNIDRLLGVLADGRPWRIKVVTGTA